MKEMQLGQDIVNKIFSQPVSENSGEVFILEGSSEYYAPTWGERGNLICLRHLFRLTEVQNMIFFKCFFHACAACTEDQE